MLKKKHKLQNYVLDHCRAEKYMSISAYENNQFI